MVLNAEDESFQNYIQIYFDDWDIKFFMGYVMLPRQLSETIFISMDIR